MSIAGSYQELSACPDTVLTPNFLPWLLAATLLHVGAGDNGPLNL